MRISVTAGSILLLVLLTACRQEPEVQEHKPQKKPAAPPEKVAQPAPDIPAGMVLGTIRALDGNGNPVAGVRPIVTKSPNAFEKPLAWGDPTGADGRSQILYPDDQRLYLRAWDPTFTSFANNYYDCIPHTGNTTDEMTIVMLPASRLSMDINNAAGKAIANSTIDIMLMHPTLGPWWPAQGTTDATGHAVIENLPSGMYNIAVRTPESATVELSELLLLPGKTHSIGSVLVNK